MVPRVAWIRPDKAVAHELGQEAAVIDMGVRQQHGIDVGGAERKGPVVQFLQRFLSLKQAAIDQKTSGAGFKEVAGARDGARGPAEPDGHTHREISQVSARISSPFKASTNKSSSAMALVEWGTL